MRTLEEILHTPVLLLTDDEIGMLDADERGSSPIGATIAASANTATRT